MDYKKRNEVMVELGGAFRAFLISMDEVSEWEEKSSDCMTSGSESTSHVICFLHVW
jgi:hypothetical protein